jgi:hypothetical protein
MVSKRIVMAASACAVMWGAAAHAATTLTTDATLFTAQVRPSVTQAFQGSTVAPVLPTVSTLGGAQADGPGHDEVLPGLVRIGRVDTIYRLNQAAYGFGAMWGQRPTPGVSLSLIFQDGTEEAVSWLTPAMLHGFMGLTSDRAFVGVRVDQSGLLRGGAGAFMLQNFAVRYVPLVAAATLVPEPSSWALAIVGFGAAGAMLRRRRVAA